MLKIYNPVDPCQKGTYNTWMAELHLAKAYTDKKKFIRGWGFLKIIFWCQSISKRAIRTSLEKQWTPREVRTRIFKESYCYYIVAIFQAGSRPPVPPIDVCMQSWERQNFGFFLIHQQNLQYVVGTRKNLLRYRKTCLTWPLKNRLNKGLNDKW